MCTIRFKIEQQYYFSLLHFETSRGTIAVSIILLRMAAGHAGAGQC